MKNKLISFSGIDSAGKTTYIQHVIKRYQKLNVKFTVIWSRGGYTSGFEFAKKVIRKIAHKKLPESGVSEQRTEMFNNPNIRRAWYIFAMLDLIRLYSVTIKLYLLFGYNIICDRYIYDTYIDFISLFGKEKIDNSLLWKLLERTSKRPAISIVLVISPEESLRRSTIKNEPFSEPIEARIERISKYMDLINKAKWNLVVNTENRSEEIVATEILNYVLPNADE